MLGAGLHADRPNSDHDSDNDTDNNNTDTDTDTDTDTGAAPTTGPDGSAAVAVHRSSGQLEVGFARCLLRHRRLGTQLESTHSAMADAALLMGETLHRNGRLIFFGNSGGGVIAGLVAASMQLRLSALARTPPRAGGLVAFALDESAASAGEESDGFAAALRRTGRAGDCAVALSTSGDAANILAALRAARAAGMVTVGLLGHDGGQARAEVDVAVTVRENDPMQVYEAQVFAGHTLCRQLEWALRPPA